MTYGCKPAQVMEIMAAVRNGGIRGICRVGACMVELVKAVFPGYMMAY